MFTKNDEELKKIGADITTREIQQQPELWQETWDIYVSQKERINEFLTSIKEKHGNVRVIFTGAGTSAYVGTIILPHLKEFGDEIGLDFQAVATTDLVSNPKSYFKQDHPTILVSFARSGNSPESIASVELGARLVKDFYQITITCAAEGKLAKRAEGDEANLLLIMPERSNDQGFAMTGSFTCMTLMSLLIFDESDNKEKNVEKIIELGKFVVKRAGEIDKIVSLDFERVIYLGSGPFAGLAREVQLKILELTAGEIATLFDSSLGFRHGPKSFVNEKALVFLFVSNDSYTRQYDLDMLKEIQGDHISPMVCSISVEQELNYAGPKFQFDKSYADVLDGYLVLPFAMFGQVLGLLTALKLGNKPDTPSPTGTVNRVVKGVTIYDNV